MQIKEGRYSRLEDLARQGAVEIGQHGDKVIERRRQHAEQRGEHHQHSRHHRVMANGRRTPRRMNQ